MDHNPYAPPTSNPEVRVERPPPPQEGGPEGLSGWLILVAIGLFITPIRLMMFLNATFPPIFSNGTWEVLTTPGNAPYHPLWGPLLISEMVINFLFIAVCVYLLVLFFYKSSRFPKVYVAFLLANLVFIAADALAVKIVMPEQPLLDGDTAREFGRAVIGAMIWIPYMFSSKRVRNTFVRTSD